MGQLGETMAIVSTETAPSGLEKCPHCDCASMEQEIRSILGDFGADQVDQFNRRESIREDDPGTAEC